MKEVTPQEAYELMNNDKDYIYLDVRSVPEFDAGHPEGAINIPLLHYTPSTGMYPNQDFPSVVEGNLSKDAKLIVGCKSGSRSAQACQMLSQMGYADVSNVRGGYGGMADNFGRMVEPGWSMLNLPVSEESAESARYDALAAKAKAQG
jgi:rhodanese-related sulfurtransferase